MTKKWKIFIEDWDSSISHVTGETYYLVGLDTKEEVLDYWKEQNPNELMNCVTVYEIEHPPIIYVNKDELDRKV